jgi:hypothetical protein
MHLSMPEMTFVKVELDSGRFKKASDLYRKVLMELPGWSGEDINGNLTAAEFGEALTAFHRRRERQHAPHRLLLVVDEYNVLIPDGAHHRGLENYLEALAVLKALHQEGWLLLLPCGKSADLSRQASWGTDENPFFHLLHPCYLGPLSRKENDDLMETLGARAGLTFTPEGLEQIYAETGGHPTLSRDLGSVLLRGGRGTVDAIRIRRALDGYMTDPSQLVILRGIYERRMNADERQIAWTIAVSGAKKEEELFPDGDVERRRQVRDALENLLATHVLLRREDGWIDHRYGLLRRVIQQEKV